MRTEHKERGENMAVICDYCPRRDDGKLDLQKAKLAKIMVRLNEARPDESKAGCEDHLEDVIFDVAPQGGMKFWVGFQIMEAN